MSRRRRRTGILGLLGVLVLGGAVGAALISAFIRTREPVAPPHADAELQIEVLNGCGSPGAADDVAMLLRRAGFLVDRVGNADHFHYRKDIVVARSVSHARATAVGRILGGITVVEQKIPEYPYDITVIVGSPRSLISGRD